MTNAKYMTVTYTFGFVSGFSPNLAQSLTEFPEDKQKKNLIIYISIHYCEVNIRIH